jgi:hypothetical protein
VAQLGSALDWGSRGRGFESRRPDECDVSGHRAHVSLDILPLSALRLVGLGRVQGEIPDELAVFSEHPYVKIGDQDEYATAGVASSEPDMQEPALVAERDLPGGVDAVSADPVVHGNDEPRT